MSGFWLFWIASVLIYVSSNFRDIATASIVLDLTGRPSGIGTLQTIGVTTNVLLMLFGGLASDRFRPHRVLLVAMLVHGAIAAVMAVLSQLGQLTYAALIPITLAGGFAGGIFSGSFYAVLPDLLASERLRRANALISVTENLGRFLVPPAAGLTLAAAGAPPALALGGAAAFCASAILGQIRVPLRDSSAGERTDENPPPAGSGDLLERLRAGFRGARADGAVWTIIWAGAILVPGSFGAASVGIPSLAKLTLAAGDAGLGLLYGALGGGALGGALAAGVVRAVRRPGIVIALSVVCEGAALIASGLTPTLWLTASALAVSGLFLAVRIILANTIIQSRTPPALRGRVISVAVLAAVAPQIVVLGGAGYVGDLLGPPAVMIIGGTLVTLGGALIASQRSIRTLTA